MTTYATGDGTRRYARRFASVAAASHFREPAGCATPVEAGPVMSSIGIGTYLGEPDEATDRGYMDAVTTAVEGGINVIDQARRKKARAARSLPHHANLSAPAQRQTNIQNRWCPNAER